MMCNYSYSSVTIIAMTETETAATDWLMLILTIPGQQPALRVRTWRRLRALGVGALRDGVYIVPNRPDLREALDAQAREVSTAGGTAQLLDASLGDGDFARLFDRREEYRAVTDAAKAAMRPARRSLTRATRTFEQLQREFEAIVN